MARFVITGTGTDIGKTVFAAGLTGLIGADYWKPVQTGVTGDGPAPQGSDAAFVRAIRKEVGQTGFSVIYDSPENLPKSEEIHTPSLWLDRVHG